MYNNISNDAKTALKSRVVTTTARITVTSNNQVIDGNNLVNVTITDQCYQDGVIVGTAMCKEVEIELIDNNYDLADKEFSLEVGVLLPNSSYEYIPYGNFIVKDYQKIISSNHYKLIAYDYMDKFNATFVDNNSTLEDGVTYTTPMTLQSFYQYVANQFGVTIETQANLPNANFSITTKPYLEGLSGRNVLSRIAEMMGCFAKINRNSKLEMKLKNVTAEQFSRNEMNNSLERDNRFGPINVISLRLSQVEGENVTKRDEASITQYGETTLQISDNPFVYTEALRLAAINAIYNKVDGFSYYPTTFNGKLIYLDTGDEVEVQDMSTDTYYKTIILKQVLKIPSTRQSKFENKALTDTGLEYQYTPEQVRLDRRTEYIVDKQNGTITQLVETTEEIEHQFETLQDIDGFAEGKYIYLDDASDELITSAKFNGETSQATRSGKNMIPMSSFDTMGNNGTGFTYDASNHRITYSNENNSGKGVYHFFDNFVVGTTYTLSFDIRGTAGKVVKIGWNKNTQDYTLKASYERVSYPFAVPTTREAIVFYTAALSNGGLTTNEYMEFDNVMITTDGSTDYEQYGVMPSPDYPSEIENLEGRNIFDEVLENGGFDTNGINGANAARIRSKNYISIKENTSYTISVGENNTGKTLQVSMSFYDTNDYVTPRISHISWTTLNKSVTFTTPSNCKYMRFLISYTDSSAITINDDFDKFMIEEGSTATTYAPYNSLEVKIGNKNLANNMGLGSYNQTTGIYSSSSTTIYCNLDLIKIDNTKDIYVSQNGNAKYVRAFWYDSSRTYLGTNLSNATTGKLTIMQNAEYVTFQGAVETFGNTTEGIQLEYGSITPYEAHEEQIVYFPLAEGQKLYEGSYLADDGIHNVRKQVVFDGSSDEGWTISGSSEVYNGLRYFITPIISDAISTPAGSPLNIFNATHFHYVSASYKADKGGGYFINGRLLVFMDYSNISDFKTWLSNNTPIVEYELNQEEVIPYNTEQQAAWNNIKSLHTYKTVTHIYSDAYAEIGYIKDNMLSAFETKASAQLTKNDVSQLKIENGRISSEVSSTQSQFNNYYTKNEADNNTNSTKAELQNIIQQNKTEIEQTTRDISFRINEIETNGVDKIETSMGYTFNNEGLNIDKEGAATASTIDNEAFKVKNKSANENVFFAGYVSDQDSAYRGQTIVESTNLVVKNYLNIEGASRFQPYVNPVLGGHGTGAFDIG